jgi:hypothetical protein
MRRVSETQVPHVTLLALQEHVLHIVATITFEQYKAALSAIRKSSQRVNKTSWPTLVFIIVFSFSLTIAAQTSSRNLTSIILEFLLLLIALCAWSKFRAQSCLKQVYEVQKRQLNSQPMDIDETGISGRWENGNASYQFKWSAFENFLDSRRIPISSELRFLRPRPEGAP